MKPAPFDYVAATDLSEALDALHDGGSDARVIAGGQSLVPMLNMRLARPTTLVDITRIPELSRIEAKGDQIVMFNRIYHGIKPVITDFNDLF